MIIRKGQHSGISFPTFLLKRNHNVGYIVQFTPSCEYDIGDDQMDINKLFGVGYFPHHHKDSVRFGWRWIGGIGLVELMAYWYKDGKRDSRHICYVGVGTKIKCELKIEENHAAFIVDGVGYAIIPFEKKRICYLLHPYFGGNKVAPHDIEIKMERI